MLAKERMAAMSSIETIGLLSDAPASQRFPPLGALFANRANVIAFVGLTSSRALAYSQAAFATTTALSPPKANEFDIAAVIGSGRASLGT
jgi:hypothetical protein